MATVPAAAPAEKINTPKRIRERRLPGFCGRGVVVGSASTTAVDDTSGSFRGVIVRVGDARIV